MWRRYSEPFQDIACNFEVGDLIGTGWGGHAEGEVVESYRVEGTPAWRIVWCDFETGELDDWVGPADWVDRRMKNNANFVIEEDPV